MTVCVCASSWHFSNSLIIVLLGASGIICSMIPIFIGWSYNYKSYDITSAIIVNSINSKEFGNSIVFCIAVLVPISIELFCDLIPFSWKLIDHNYILRLGIVLSQLIPNLIIFFVAIPYNSPTLIVITFQIRDIAGTCAVYAKISEVGSPIFRVNSIVLLTVTAIICCLCSTYSPFLISTSLSSTLLVLNALSGTIHFACFGFQTIRWIHRIRLVGYKDITIDQLVCTLYLVIIFFLMSGIGALNVIYKSNMGPDTTSNYLVPYNYLIAVFALSLSVIQSRIIHKEKDIVMQSLETKRLFVRFVSHEIRTPLNTVFLGLKLLREEIPYIPSLSNNNNNINNITTFETLDDIQQSCDIALNILNDLLSFEKIESGLLVLEKEEVQPKDWLSEVVNPFYVQARKLDIGLEVAYDISCDESRLDGLTLVADRAKISQVIRNVLSNALKFTPSQSQGQGLVTVTASTITKATALSKNKNYSRAFFFRIQIVDNGHGIAEENICKLFNEIIQFNASKLQAGGGSGLGLWISRAIVDKHQGSITAHSDGLGQGSTFTIDLPLTETANIPQMNNSNSISHQSFPVRNVSNTTLSITDRRVFPVLDRRSFALRKRSTKIAGRESVLHWPLHVLVVDDSSLNRKMLVRLIEKRFLTVREAVDGVDAVNQMKESMSSESAAIDVVLMDYVMPNMDGPTATSEIRQLGYSGLILGITGNALQEDIDIFISHGADKVMVKPVDVDALIGFISDRFIRQL